MSDDASEVFDEWIKSLAAEQQARKGSLEDRALNLVKSAAALVGLLFALVAFLTDSDSFELPASAKVSLGLATVLFTGSGLFAIVSNAPRSDYHRAKADEIGAELERRWDLTTDIAHRMIVRTRLDLLEKDTAANDDKASHLLTAVRLEISAIAAVAVAVITILLD